ncbi:helix-turn-helix domain-containing protein [Variovorax boronicumulans]|uniref:helix-turn-helix domain-containing protein n=1 Tax=Variovorax boronicumulans TaxID=436515 RepID=UPI001C55A663
MDKKALIEQLATRRDALGLTLDQVAQRAGLTERSVRNALGPQANPQLSSLLALADALELEFHLAPRGFGAPGRAADDPAYRPVATRVGAAVAASPPGKPPSPAS